jgi:putative membrane protein insertion efficiency factor
MPTLRNRVLRPKYWLAALLLLVMLAGADALRAPPSQVSVRVFAASVEGYHRFIHPVTGRFIRCRYTPTCSAYAVEAVRKYGIAKGGWMGARRVLSCRSSVKIGTFDPVP